MQKYDTRSLDVAVEPVKTGNNAMYSPTPPNLGMMSPTLLAIFPAGNQFMAAKR
jgi:hypothetical protein